jgi:hypothetical protein
MLLSARPLINVANVNTWSFADQIAFTQGDQVTIYFQLIDVLKDTSVQGFKPAGRRYIPASGATLSVTIPNIDTSKILTKVATNPYANDTSIWSFTILPTDPVVGTITLKLALTEGGVITYGVVNTALSIVPQDGSFC